MYSSTALKLPLLESSQARVKMAWLDAQAVVNRQATFLVAE
jgi:hypothetical protein